MVSQQPSAAEKCDIERFRIVARLIPLAQEVQINDFTIQRKKILSQQAEIDRQLKINPISISANTSNSQNFGNLKKSNQLSSQKNSLGLSYEINQIKISNNKKQLGIQRELLEFEMLKLKAQESVTVYEGLLEYLMGAELDELFKIEKRYYEIKRDYLNERSEFGDLNLENLLEVEKEIRNISDKILANSVKQIERLNFLNITKEFIPNGYVVSNSKLDTLPRSCNYEALSQKGLKVEKKLAEHKLKSLDLLNDAKVSFKVQLSDEQTSNQYQNNIGASLEINVPLYDGGILNTKRKTMISEDEIIQAEMRLEEKKFSESLETRLSTESVFYESFKSIEREINALKIASDELETRQGLGQGVFEERLNNNLQILGLEQARLRLITDFISGWVKFLGTVQNGLR